MTGIVKWFDDARGYGFIQVDDTNEEVFVHYSGIVMEGHKSLPENVRVKFNIKNTQKGKCAVDVVLI